MASISISSPTLGFSSASPPTRRRHVTGFRKISYSRSQPAMMAVTTDASVVIRRTAHYPPSEWSYDFLQSLAGNTMGEKHQTTSHNLKEQVRSLISKETSSVENPLSLLRLVDDLQRLGVSYHFKDEISNVLKMIYGCYYEAHENWIKMSLNLKALGFRLLRQHGYHIPQEIFKDIKDESGSIKDVEGMLNLYEASFYAVDGENILDETREFTRKRLREELDKNNIVNKSTRMLVSHALENPLLWRLPRFESLWFIEAYKGRSDMIPLLFEFAKLDYNILQGIHQDDLKLTSRWWASLNWDKKLEFARDRMVESFMWSMAANHEPQFSIQRRNVTKVISMVNVVDDVYDVYGTLDELERFTEVVRSIEKELQNVIQWSAIVLRLADDLGTASAELARGDVPKAVQCYMHETGVSEEKARAYIKSLIIEAYKKITKERMACKSPALQVFMECASNLGRMGQFTYERGDMFGSPDDLYKDHQMSLLFNPIS
ncbi:hypothetical protein SSX86_002668 [Deinandra increscens subsp. villosa]|uniref:Uncharacterized protein n=1 Tax=Deinandra increscens subsp. villosa TaxID=3103831 RepID=A0AAP0DP36_9ASTR